MKNSLIACLILCFSMSFAQLSVQNDAYVFVSDQYIYVTDDVNIDDADSKIYLRNEAQLLQGSGTTGNSGVGELSVYQEGNTNQWAYNYWCSPVGGVLSDNSINNAFRTNQIDDPLLGTLDPLDSNDTAFTAAYDGSASPLTISDRWLWTYQVSSLYADWVYVGSAGDIAPGLGFTMKGTGTGVTESTSYDFRGKPNNGDITIPVSDGDFTLVGNPYPSAMDSAALIHDIDNVGEILGTLFYWEQDTSILSTQSHVLQDYVGGYSEFTIDEFGVISSNVPATFFKYDEQDNVLPLPPGPPGVGTKLAQRFIPIGQGFMVEGIAGISNTITFKNEHRIFEKQGANSVFFRSNSADNSSSNSLIQFQDNGLSIIPDDYKRFRINVEFSVDNSQYVRQMLLNFHDSATMSYDRGLELHRSSNLSSDAYFVQEDAIFSGLAFPFTDSLKIPLVVDIEQQQPLRFRVFDIQNFEESQGIYIHDNDNDTFVNLRNLNYEINIEPGNYTDRFEIVFTSESSLDVDGFDMNTLTINQDNGFHQLSVINPKNLNISAIEVYDISGKRLLHSVFDTILNRYEFSTTDLTDGVYIVNVTSNTSAVKSQKIIIKN